MLLAILHGDLVLLVHIHGLLLVGVLLAGLGVLLLQRGIAHRQVRAAQPEVWRYGLGDRGQQLAHVAVEPRQRSLLEILRREEQLLGLDLPTPGAKDFERVVVLGKLRRSFA